MFAPPRGLSQLAAPFIVFWRQGIHHIPILACLYSSILRHRHPGWLARNSLILFIY